MDGSKNIFQHLFLIQFLASKWFIVLILFLLGN